MRPAAWAFFYESDLCPNAIDNDFNALCFCAVALLGTLNAHSGFHFPLMASPEAHDFHHLKFNQCYGVLGVLDWLHGTDTLFRDDRRRRFGQHLSENTLLYITATSNLKKLILSIR